MFEESIGGSIGSDSPQQWKPFWHRGMQFFDFSNVPRFPNHVLDREAWEHFLLWFMGNEYNHHVEHMLNFHECMHRLGIIHEDVLMNMFRYSLEGKAREWCRSLPVTSIASLIYFHVAFNSYCKQKYYVDFFMKSVV
jgi:hypothetical protein